jgi:succinate dehydrogenase / fumarate reductase flavoprotein subunit
LFAAGECASGINGANRLGGNSLSDLIVFGKRAGEYAARFARENRGGTIDPAQIEGATKAALAPFDRAGANAGEGPFQIQETLQETMQDLVGIVRTESEMQQAVKAIDALKRRAEVVAVRGNREYNPGWHTALDLGNLLTVSEAITRAAIDRKESRGGHFRDDYPDKDPAAEKFNIIVRKGAGGAMELSRQPIPPMPDHLKAVIEEMKG